MQKTWKEQIEISKSSEKYTSLEKALKNAMSGNGVLKYKKEGNHYVVESEKIQFLLSSIRKFEEGVMKEDIFVYSGKMQSKDENHITIVTSKQDEWVAHRHNFYEIIFVLYGKIMQQISEIEFEIHENEVLILNQNVMHRERFIDDAIVLFIECSKSAMDEIVMESHLSEETMAFFGENNKEKHEYIHFKPKKTEAVKILIEQLLNEQCNNNAGKIWMTFGLMARLLTVLDNKEEYLLNLFSEDLSDNIRIFKNLEEYLEQRKWNIEKGELTKKFHYNENYLSHLVKKITGMSLVNYCIAHKLSHAEYLLCHSELSVNEIINQIGYQNKTYFYRKFKQKYGVSPLQMREDVQKGYRN